MSHVYSGIVSSVLANIGTEYGKILKITIPWGKIHKYLRMTIKYSSTLKVNISMVYYIGKMFDDNPEDMRGESSELDAHHLFDITEDVNGLSLADI